MVKLINRDFIITLVEEVDNYIFNHLLKELLTNIHIDEEEEEMVEVEVEEWLEEEEECSL